MHMMTTKRTSFPVFRPSPGSVTSESFPTTRYPSQPKRRRFVLLHRQAKAPFLVLVDDSSSFCQFLDSPKRGRFVSGHNNHYFENHSSRTLVSRSSSTPKLVAGTDVAVGTPATIVSDSIHTVAQSPGICNLIVACSYFC
ncbi:hypothetical protein HanRHA438_Chr14g0681841 [Helianthus annuus]|nr:hypothetical protein HanIR_Chr14g0727491 [Helianthus annuus]KAJ0856211.1 hypothetical protein HanRHA438_Chr14g0681841 [Helianthus annuus]